MNFRKLVKKLIPKNLFWKIEPTGHFLESFFFNLINLFPLRKINVIGVTGTNGKTTTTLLIHNMLNQAGYRVGFNSTIGYGYKDEFIPQIHHMTNVSTREMLSRVKKMKKQGMEWLVLETTSHALAQYRVWGVPYSVAVFTNLTHEHLAYHRTFERYRQAKVKLFKMTNRNRRGLRFGVINSDDENSPYFEKNINSFISYGLKSGDLQPVNTDLQPNKLSYDCSYEKTDYHIVCQIPGSFNVYNSLAVLAVGIKLKLTKDQIENGISSLNFVEGRMNLINQGQPFTVIIDYAHSPDSFDKLFKDIAPMAKNKLIVLFGSLGGGDIGKRAIQGQLAGKYADYIYVCQEDDRQEDGQNIMNDIASGIKKEEKKEGTDFFLIHDRPEAILAALRKAQKDDIVLFLGKGHEKTIEDKTGEHPWNETEVVIEKLAEIGYKNPTKN